MLLELTRQYADIIQDMEVERLRVLGASYELRASIVMQDGSTLFVKDYLFVDGTRKYAYHWQDREGHLLRRWENAPHWQAVASHLHHQRMGAEGVVIASEARTPEEALQ